MALNQAGAGGNGGTNLTDLSVASGGINGNGGGIYNDPNNTDAIIRNSLIASNIETIGGPGGTSREFLALAGNQFVEIEDSIGDGLGIDVAGDFISQGFNLVGMADGSTGFTNDIDADQVGSNANPLDPLLGPLQFNGGFTPTQMLLPGSPGIDKGKCFGTHIDQRGHHRPNDTPSVSNAPGGDGSDIGAVESAVPRIPN
jgi:hypothetical protein